TVRIEQHFSAIEPMSVLGLVWAGDAVAVDLSSLDARHEDVPVVIRAVGVRIETNRARRTRILRPIEEEQVHARRGAREDAEIDAGGRDRGTKRRASPFDLDPRVGHPRLTSVRAIP